MEDTQDFLTAMWGPAPDDHYFLIWTMPDKRSRWFRCTDEGIEAAAAMAERLSTNDVYMGVALSAQSYGSRQRVTAADTVGISALWADVDFLENATGDAHKKSNLPPTKDDALALIDKMPPASYVVHSGNGLQAWWLLDEHLRFTSRHDRLVAADLSHRWIGTLRSHASKSGWTIDATHDLARVMRLPGTFNQKSDPPRPVHFVRQQPAVRHEIDHLRKAADAPPPDQVDVSTPAPPMSTTFELRPDATPPFLKWEALRKADRNIELTFDHKRRFSDQSPSGYDMALANYAALAGWEDQEIVDLLIYHRRTHGHDTKVDRPDYFARTLRKARDSATRASAADQIEVALSQLEDAPSEAAKDEGRLQLLDWLSPILKTGINRIERYGTEPIYFRMLTEAGWVNLGGADQILNQTTMRARMVEITRTVFPRMKARDWDQVAEAIVRAAIDVDLGPEPTVIGSLRGWLDDYLEQHLPAEEIDETVATSRTPFVREGHVAIFPSHFKGWLERAHGEKLSLRDVAMRLRMAGARPYKVNVHIAGRPTSRSVWTLPDEFDDTARTVEDDKD